MRVIYNDRLAVGLELDILIPELGIAFELNGKVHYQPIFGQSKLDITQSNDAKKLVKCKEKNITLYVIDISHIPRFSEESSNEIYSFILKKLAAPLGVEPSISP